MAIHTRAARVQRTEQSYSKSARARKSAVKKRKRYYRLRRRTQDPDPSGKATTTTACSFQDEVEVADTLYVGCWRPDVELRDSFRLWARIWDYAPGALLDRSTN
ncbi:hypothetical protein Pst134EB_024977 [Puccinia striiformis f. sp. tritici]|nr:hypothetical protein Pst134EB_024977 [Puccinia striiformis f. sp. tritici]